MGDMWIWDGNNWVKNGSYPNRYWYSISYDKIRNRIVIFGGFRQSKGTLNDTQEWGWFNMDRFLSPKLIQMLDTIIACVMTK